MTQPDRDMAGATAAQKRLIASLEDLTDEQVRSNSLLPGWSVAHVLTHLARNADSHGRMLEASQRGEISDQYRPGSREVEIEAGAVRPARELVDDVAEACERLETTWHSITPETWKTGRGRPASGEIPVADLPFRRWREVEIHHVDLGLGFSINDWTDDYVDLELDRAIADLAPRLEPGSSLTLEATDSSTSWTVSNDGTAPVLVKHDRRQLLAWLIGRLDVPRFPSLTPW